jgi:hypothetical protein
MEHAAFLHVSMIKDQDFFVLYQSLKYSRIYPSPTLNFDPIVPHINPSLQSPPSTINPTTQNTIPSTTSTRDSKKSCPKAPCPKFHPKRRASSTLPQT